MKLSLKQTILTILLILTPVLLSMLPFFIQSYMSPIDRVFMGLHRWSEDYYGYLHTINQGLMGHLQTVSKLTLQSHQPTFVHSEYTLLGLVGRFFSLNSPLVYHLSRLFLGTIFVFVAFYFLYFLFTKDTKRVANGELGKFSRSRATKGAFDAAENFYQETGRQDPLFQALLAFFLAFFVGGFPHITSLRPLHLEPYLSWWTELDVLTRSTILPHYLMGNIFFLLILILFLKITYPVILGSVATPESKKMDSGQARMTRYYIFLISFFSFLLAFVHPVDFLILICSLGTFVFFQIIINLLNRKPYTVNRILSSILSTKYQLLLLLLVFISGLLPALYYRYALSLPFWRFILAHGTTTAYNIPLSDLTMALGPVFFLGIGGIIFFLVSLRGGSRSETTKQSRSSNIEIATATSWPRNDKVKLLLFSWLFVQTLFFLKFYQVFNFDRLRTMEAPFYIPLAFFSTLLIMSLRGVPTYVGMTKQSSPLMRLPRPFGARNDIVLILLVFLITLPTTFIGLHNQIFAVSDFKTFSLFSYPTIKQYQSWLFLRDHTPDNSAITTLYEAKFLLPTVSGNKIAFGANFDNDPNYQNYVNKINKLYSYQLSDEDTQNFLTTNHIQYVYWGYQEQSLGGDLTKYPFLQKIFDNGEVIIFKVK